MLQNICNFAPKMLQEYDKKTRFTAIGGLEKAGRA